MYNVTPEFTKSGALNSKLILITSITSPAFTKQNCILWPFCSSWKHTLRGLRLARISTCLRHAGSKDGLEHFVSAHRRVFAVINHVLVHAGLAACASKVPLGPVQASKHPGSLPPSSATEALDVCFGRAGRPYMHHTLQVCEVNTVLHDGRRKAEDARST